MITPIEQINQSRLEGLSADLGCADTARFKAMSIYSKRWELSASEKDKTSTDGQTWNTRFYRPLVCPKRANSLPLIGTYQLPLLILMKVTKHLTKSISEHR